MGSMQIESSSHSEKRRQGEPARSRSGATSWFYNFALPLVAVLTLTACAQQVTMRGAMLRETDLQQVQPGIGQEQVRMALGTPTTTTTTGSGNVYYYISSKETQSAFFKPTEVDRQVVAVYFSPMGSVERVANYGMQDGKVVDINTRKTPAPGSKDENIVKQLFRNLGQKQLFGE
jgi:outer membrane protein assembly factor BamE (lipoprotein component of BamABCDE complex)